MTEHRFKQEIAHCNRRNILLAPLCNEFEALRCSEYGYATYYVAAVPTEKGNVTSIVVKPEDWPRLTFGVIAGDGCTVDYQSPEAECGEPQLNTLAIQLTRLSKAHSQGPLVVSETAAIDAAIQACRYACCNESMTIRRHSTGMGGYVLIVCWIPANVKFWRVQLVVVPINWTVKGFGVMSPMPRTDRDARGKVTMNSDSIAVHYMHGDLESVLRAHILKDRLSSFSE